MNTTPTSRAGKLRLLFLVVVALLLAGAGLAAPRLLVGESVSFPGGARPVEFAGTVADPGYQADRWLTTSVDASTNRLAPTLSAWGLVRVGTADAAGAAESAGSHQVAYQAAAVVLGRTSGPVGVYVSRGPRHAPSTFADAAGLRTGDVLTEVAGQKVTEFADYIAVMRTHFGQQVPVVSYRNGQRHTSTGQFAAQGEALGYQFLLEDNVAASVPFSVVKDSRVGGASGGLITTLAYLDALTPADLSGTLTVAGTGTIAADGTVGPIDGPEHKVIAADRAGADVFFAPAGENYDAAAASAKARHLKVPVVAVATVNEAVDWLCANTKTTSTDVCSQVRR